MNAIEIVNLLEAVGFEFELETYISKVGIAVARMTAVWNGHWAYSDEEFIEEYPDCTAMSLQAASRLLGIDSNR